MKNRFLTLNELKTSSMLKFSLQNTLQSFESFILIWCKRLPIYGSLKKESQVCLLIDFGSYKTYNQRTF